MPADLINFDDNNNDISNFHMSNDGMINNNGQIIPPQLPSTLPYGDKYFSKQSSPPPYYNNGATNNNENNNMSVRLIDRYK
jgi:hypothetical protein